MTKEVRALFLILILIVAPFLIYAFLQVRSLDEDEKMAAAAYEKQMEAVLFSLNQYADDMMGRWMRQLTDDQQSITENANMLILGNESIQMLVLRNMQTHVDTLCGNDYVAINNKTKEEVDLWYSQKDSVLNRLSQYLDAGFQKIQPADDWISVDGLRPDQTGFTIMVYDQDSILHNALLIVERKFWIEQILGPRVQEINHDEFSIAVDQWPISKEPRNMLYRTTTFEPKKSYVKSKLWLLPNTFLLIQPKGKSYTELIKIRSQENLYFLVFSLLAMAIGSYLMIRNIRNALKIAQLKSDFVSNVSHEIRTPLSLIRMYAETLMLGRVPSEEKKNHYYQTIHHESGRLTFLVNNILDFSRIEGNRKTYRFENNDLNRLTQSLYESYSHYFVEKKIECQLTLATQALPVSIDTQAFEEAMSNLIENAIKYGNGQTEIAISTFVINGYACCSIKDQGIGISKSAQKHIFDKFYRVESALTQKTKGTGLGLSLVKHIMQSHHGEVVVESRVNVGSTFTLKFPLTESKNE